MDKVLNKGASGYLSNTTLLSDLTSSMIGNWTLSLYVVTPLVPVDASETSKIIGFNTTSFIPKPKPVLTGELTSWDLTFVYTNSTNVNLTENLSNLWFNPLVYGATAPSFMTQSETNWLTYWKDTSKTFEYYADTTIPLDESTKVEISTTFSYSPVSSSYQLTNGNSVDNTELQVSRLAPSILNNEQSKFDGQGITAITYPTSTKSLYVYDYIMPLVIRRQIFRENAIIEIICGLTETCDIIFSSSRLYRIEYLLNNTIKPIRLGHVFSYVLLYIFIIFILVYQLKRLSLLF
jgi:hypothetical protein